MQTIEGDGQAGGYRFALVVSKYHEFVTERLKTAALAALAAAGAPSEAITIVRVPGAFEIPLAAQHLAESGRYDAVICLGCLIQGETPHMGVIASAVADGLAAAAGATGVPISFGVLTTNSMEEAVARAGEGPTNKGHEAAIAAIEMASIAAQLTRPPSAARS
jgi:6,7-dimethyl-8-ribityllumazine synthase